MSLDPNLLLPAFSAIAGVGLGLVTALKGSETKPVWPLRYLLRQLSARNQFKALKRYAEKRRTYSFREQFLASAFIWFFIFMVTGILVLAWLSPCPGRGGC